MRKQHLAVTTTIPGVKKCSRCRLIRSKPAAGSSATSNVTYAYDAAGNRKSMSDTSGNAVSYNYDPISRLTSEARQFTGLTGTYTLAYEYNLRGQVKTVADQTAGTSFSYTNDHAGRLSSITRAGVGASAPLVSNAQYRASVALKYSEYGNGTGMNLGYNGRGLISQDSLTGVIGIDRGDTNGAGSVRIGDIGGPGGNSSDLYPNRPYIVRKSHIRFVACSFVLNGPPPITTPIGAACES